MNTIGEKNKEYLAFIAGQRCWACELVGHNQTSRTECAHVGLSTSRRGLSQRYSDFEALPLCAEHHREGDYSIHKLGVREFFDRRGTDRDTAIWHYQQMYAMSKESV